MLWLIRAGGFPMWFILLFGSLLLLSTGWFAVRPDERRLGLARGAGLATLFSTLAATAAALGATFHTLAGEGDRHPELSIVSPDGPRALLMGLAESMSPMIMGFTFLSLAGFLYAVGAARASR